MSALGEASSSSPLSHDAKIEEGEVDLASPGFIQEGEVDLASPGFIQDGEVDLASPGFIQDGEVGLASPGFIQDGEVGLASPGWYHPRNLPHFDGGMLAQSITYRLSDSLPRGVAERLASELGDEGDTAYRRRIEQALDQGLGSGCLIHEPIASAVIEAWTHGAGHRYEVHAWVIMPNHVHILITPFAEWSLGKIVQSWKSWIGKRIKAHTGSVTWQRDYWDRFIRDEAHYRGTVEYIHQNPTKAGLVAHAKDWRWSSLGEASSSSPVLHSHQASSSSPLPGEGDS